MLTLFKGAEERKEFLSTFQDPFKKDGIERVMLWIRKDDWNRGQLKFTATVYFRRGTTSGEHDIKAESFSELVHMVEDFIKSL